MDHGNYYSASCSQAIPLQVWWTMACISLVIGCITAGIACKYCPEAMEEQKSKMVDHDMNSSSDSLLIAN